jgi:formylmethanofuran dehydrogenase subunit E
VATLIRAIGDYVATRQKQLLEQLIKQWAQDHCVNYTIANYQNSEEAMKSTQEYFTWIIREGHANIDLFALVNHIEIFIESQRNRKFPDGMYCAHCHNFYEFAESNQVDGTLVCYSCLHPCG